MLRFIVTCLPTAALWVLFHMGRHTFAVLCLNNGVGIETLAKMMGHTDIKTTQIYAKVLDEQVEQAFDDLEARLNR